MSDVLDDAIVHLEVEITFAMEYNETIKMELDEVFTKNQGTPFIVNIIHYTHFWRTFHRTGKQSSLFYSY